MNNTNASKKYKPRRILTEEVINAHLSFGAKIKYETFRGSKKPAVFIDPEYGEFTVIVSRALTGSKHPLRRLKRTSPRIDIHISEMSPEITMDKSTFTSFNKKAKFIDKDYGEFWAKPCNVFYNKSGHPKRGKVLAQHRLTKSIDVLKKELFDLFKDQVVLDESTYINAGRKAKFIDKDYGAFWRTPANVLCRKSAHPKRSYRRRSTSFLPNGMNVHEYCDLKKVPSVTAHMIYRRMGSDVCFDWINNYKAKKSSSEILFQKIMTNTDSVQCTYWNKQAVTPKKQKLIYRPDFQCVNAVTQQKIYVDIDGLRFHSTGHMAGKVKNYHYAKREVYNKHNLTLIQIRHNEMYKSAIVQSIIKAKLGILDHKYYARKLQLKNVLSSEAQVFLQENHLMGEYKSAKYVGLFHQDELVSLIGYRKHKDGIDISRFCNKLNTSVAGGLSKLLKHIEQTEQPKFIQSWVDLRYGSGNSLVKLGFEHTKTTLGWQWTDFEYTYNRLRCRANMDSRGLTEKQHAEELGWCKIYDAGQALFVKKTK